MPDVKTGLVVFAAIAIGLFLLSQFAPIAPGYQSVVGLSRVGDKWVGSLVVNQGYEEFQLQPTGATAEDAIKLSFRQLNPSCQYPVYHQSKTFTVLLGSVPIYKMEYLTLGGGKRRVPYAVAVYRNGRVEDNERLELLESSGDIFSPTTLSLAEGNVKLTNLGQLGRGINCPNGGDVLLFYDHFYSKRYIMLDRPSWEAWLNELNSAANTLNLSQVITMYNSTPDRAKQMVPSGGWLDDVVATNVNEIAPSPANGSMAFQANLEKNVASAMVSFEVDSDYMVTYTAPEPVPRVDRVWMEPVTLVEAGSRGTLKVKVKNVGSGEAGRIEVFPSSVNGLLSFAPVSAAEDFDAGETRTIEFSTYALNAGSYSVRVRAYGVNTGASSEGTTTGTVTDNISIPPVEPGPVIPPDPPVQPELPPSPVVPFCGNGVCEIGEALWCFQDCPPGPAPEPEDSAMEACFKRPGDGLFISAWTWVTKDSPIFLLGFIPIQVGTATEASCQPAYNWALVALIGIAAFAAVFLVLRWK